MRTRAAIRGVEVSWRARVEALEAGPRDKPTSCAGVMRRHCGLRWAGDALDSDVGILMMTARGEVRQRVGWTRGPRLLVKP